MTPLYLPIRKRVILGLLSISIFAGTNSQTIDKNVFGQNAWVYTVGKISGSTNTGGQLDNHYNNNDIGNSNVGSMRFGGISVNQELQDLWMYAHNVTMMKQRNITPLVMVPIGEKSGLVFKDHHAANIVTYLNSSLSTKCEFYIIGNEPDHISPPWTSSEIAAYTQSVASAMKNIDQNIKIIGPELASFDPTLVSSLISNSSFANSIDYFSFHYYALGDEGKWEAHHLAPHRSNVVGTLTNDLPKAGFPGSTIGWQQTTALKNNITSFQTSHSKPLAITEANICYANDVGGFAVDGMGNPVGTATASSTYLQSQSTQSPPISPQVAATNDDLAGNGANSFIAGQFWAELIGLCMEKNISFLNFWSVREGNSNPEKWDKVLQQFVYTGRPYDKDIGYLNNNPNRTGFSAGAKKPTYEHFKALATRMYGTYIPGNVTTGADFKLFGSKNCTGRT